MNTVSASQDKGGIGETIRVVVHALLIALIIRTILFQPFSIPSGSMKSTLLIGDYLFVSKYAYGYSRHSLPFSPKLFEGRIFGSAPERGDVVVFKLPSDGETDFIKRVIGLPGDKIQVRSGVLFINGEEVKREKIEDFVDTNGFGAEQTIARYTETLPNGVKYSVLDATPNGFLDNTPIYEVPEGHYFMMGDNRDNSNDSRVLSQVGYIPEENLVGRAEVIFFSIKEGASAWQVWKWPTDVRWGRIFDGL